MTNVSFPVLWALPPIHILLASSVPCIALSHLETWCILRRCIQPREMIRSLTHKPSYIFLKTATIPTYHGISIAIPRYIAMQLPLLLFIIWLEFHCHFALHDHIELTWYMWLGHRSSLFTCYARSLHILVHCQRHSYVVIYIFWVMSKKCNVIRVLPLPVGI